MKKTSSVILFAALFIFCLLAGCAATGSATFDIDTPYGVVKYPEKWQKQVKVEKIEEADRYTLSFCATLDSGKELKLFDVIFGGEYTYNLGYVTKDGNEIGVCLVSCEFAESDGLTAEEETLVYEMKDDCSVVEESIKQMNGYKSAE